MRNKKPPFEITNAMIDHVAEIAELVGRTDLYESASANPTLRRTNRIRTIHGSLAIEQNTLSLEQVTAVLNGKQVLAPPKDIAEVKNAYEIYERLEELDPYSVDDLLTAHSIMTRGLVDESGIFRTRPVGVVDQEGHVLHFGTLPQYVPALVMELLGWTKIRCAYADRSCVFHYEFELIHPLPMVTAVWAACGIRCCFLNGILPLPGCRWSPSFIIASRSIMRPSMLPMMPGSPRCLLSLCSQPSKHRSLAQSTRVMK